MAGVLLANFVYVLFFCAASCQQIYVDDKNYCDRNDQTIEILNDKIEYLRQENARQAESLKHENTRIVVNQKNIQAEFNELFNILMKNVTNIHEDLKSNILQTINEKIEYLRQENARQAESLKHEKTRIAVTQKNIQEEFNELFNILIKNETSIREDLKSNILQTINEKIEYLRQENARQIESLKRENARQTESLKRENARINVNQTKIQEEFYEMFNILMKNVTNIHEGLKNVNSKLQTIKSELNLYKDCKDLYNDGYTESGIYEIYPFGNDSKISVFCDMMTEGGGWTAIQKRVSGAVSFDRNWTDYKTGFGNPSGSYWIGNDVIQQLTRGRNSSLYVSITLTNGTKLYELYNQFSVADEINKYRLFLGGPATGTLGDSMLHTGDPDYHDLSGMSFSTPDRDNDGWSGGNCVAGGGWWFNDCHRAFLNGRWSPGYWTAPWSPTVTDSKQIKETLMMIKHN